MEILLRLIVPILPTIILVLGGQLLIDRYAISRKKRETEMELIKSIREKQYATLVEFYQIFARYMNFYRLINSPLTDMKNISLKTEIFNQICKTESEVDALVLKIGCEFADATDNIQEVENLLGELRQSVQIWREKIVHDEKLPFTSSNQEDYLRFKIAFSYIAAYMINKIQHRFETPKVIMKQVEGLLVGAFDNKHEKWNKENLDRDLYMKYLKNT